MAKKSFVLFRQPLSNPSLPWKFLLRGLLSTTFQLELKNIRDEGSGKRREGCRVRSAAPLAFWQLS